jgi:CPA2 family monovalent cation:H+ antiporter-2
MMLSESQLSQQAATESLPLRDAFAVLFFVSVGMLFDPAVLLAAPLALLATVAIILIGKSVVAFFVVRLFGHPRSTALMISASLAQIGEFSFILADRSRALGLLPEDGRNLILAAAIISILVNPLLFAALDLYASRRDKALAEAAAADAREEEVPMREPIRPTTLRNHVVLVGHGRVGSFISSVLGEQSVPLFVIEDDEDGVAALRQEGIAALEGNAADPAVIEAANLPEARCLLVAIPDAFEGGQVVQQAHAINPSLPIIARAHSEEEIDYLKRHGATLVVMGEHEIAKTMLDNVAQIALLVAQSSREAAAVQPQSMPVEKAASTS